MDTTILIAILAVYAVLNVIAFLSFVWDKHKAQNDMWRTKESTLILLALFGPFGATIGMLTVRHKTKKPKFKLVYLFLIIHIIVIVYLIWSKTISF
jgi:uncharacterized membrane protein YsdA (DUF1294 family)